MKHIIRLFKLAKPWSKHLTAATISVLLITGVNLFSPYITRQIIAMMEGGNLEASINKIITLALILLVMYILRAVFQFCHNYLSHVASWNLVTRMRNIIYEHLQKLSMSYYSDKQTGQLMSRVVNDTAAFETLIAHAVPELATSVLTLIGVFVILLFINPTLTLLIMVPIPFITFFSVLMKRIRKHFKQGQEKIAELNAVLQDNFSGMKEIQVFNKQVFELERVSKKTREHSTALIKALFYSAILHPSVNLITSAGTIIVLIGGPLLAIKAGLQISDVVAFLLYLNLFYTPIASLTRIIEDIQLALAGAERVFEVLDTDSDVKDRPDAIKVGCLKGDLEFRNVCFSYANNIPVLEDISFKVEAGRMLAVVGPTGVGKTTLSALIARFYDVKSGSITIDGIDISGMTLESLRDQLSLVLQDVFLFNGTIAENISYGCEGATREEIEEAAKVACIHDYIDSLPEKYETVIGERGVRLSGGQKQRISIARSVLRDSPILILDEATSSVDTETEAEIQKAINKIAGTRTLIVIAHRLSTVKLADKIIVLVNNRIAEVGKHDELIEKNGIYTNLCRIQSLQ